MSQARKLKQGLGVLLGLALLAWVGLGYWRALTPEPVVLQGQLEVKEVRIGAKVAGRIGEIFVREGDFLTVGTPILRLDSPEIEAKVAQAQAARDASVAVADKAQAGARAQEVAMAREQMERAQAGFEVARKSNARVQALVAEGLVSQQKADEAQAQFVSAQKQYQSAQAQYSLAKEGARIEDIEAANAQVRLSDARVAEAQVAEQESHLQSPIAGEVASVLASEGEIVGQGMPVVTLIDLHAQRLELNVREDYLRFFALGEEFEARIPALEDRVVRFRVYASSVLPNFATWRPTRQAQGYDKRTFLVKAEPLTIIEDMRAGMSVLVRLPDEALR